MTLEYVDNNLGRKINENEEFIKYTFYELRVRENLTENEMYSFLALAKTKLANLNYKIYRRGQKYIYDYKEQIVNDNELLVAIKNKKR